MIRSNPETVARLLADQYAREERARDNRGGRWTRQYHPGPDANPGWPCQGGLPSLGKGYS